MIRRGNILPVAVSALAIVAFLAMVWWAISPEFRWPWSTKATNTQVACTLEAILCPDGSYVRRQGPVCAFTPCPSTNANTSNANVSISNTSVNLNTNTTATTSLATVVYTRQVNIVGTNSTYQLWRKADGKAAELLITFSKADGQPTENTLSHDHHFLAFIYPKRIDIFDLSSKKVVKSVTMLHYGAGAEFSQDNSHLFIWDQKQDTDDNSYVAHSVTLSTMTDEQLAKGKATESFKPVAWRSDDIVLMMRYYYPIGTLFSFSPSSNRIRQVEDTSSTSRLVSPSGNLYGLSSSISNICNDYSGSAFSTYTLKDSRTVNVVGTIGDGKNENALIAFSPNEDEVAWSSQSIPTDQSGCTSRTTLYYRQKIANGTPEPVTKISDLLRDWNAAPLIRYGGSTATAVKIFVNDEEWNLGSNATVYVSYYQ